MFNTASPKPQKESTNPEQIEVTANKSAWI